MKKLYRSRRDSKLFGLCGGLAELLNVDSTLLRVVLLVTTFFTGGTLIPIYFIACLVIPKEPLLDSFYDPNYGYAGKPPGYGPYSSNHGPSHYGGGHNGPHQPYGSGGSSYSGEYGPKPPAYGSRPQPQSAPGSSGPSLDEMMRDVEKKALQKEIDDLRAKLARLEKGDSDKQS